ncbi:hypothetical protein KIPB_016022, partial [Kipferlia bialata]|eukprot:g16022.t1
MGADLSGHGMYDMDLSSCNLSNAVLGGCNLCCTNITGCKTEGIVLEGASLNLVAGLTEGVLRGAKSLKKVSLVNFDMRRYNLSELDLSGAHFVGCKMAHCILNDTSLRDSRIERCDFSHSSLNGVDFSGSVMRHSDLYSVDLTTADLSGASWDSTNSPKSVPLDASRIRGARLALDLKPTWTSSSLRSASWSHGSSRTPHCVVPMVLNLRWFIDVEGASVVQ